MAGFTHTGYGPYLEADRASAKVDARQWNGGVRLEALANLAHELRTPVQVLLGYIDILRDELGEAKGSRSRHIVERLNANAHDLAQTVENLMEFALTDAEAAPAVEEFSLADLIADLSPALEAANEDKNLEITIDFDSAPPRVRSRRRAIRSILLNLAINAIKFTERGGVWIAARRQHEVGQREHLELEVSDTGPGIEPDLLEQAFEPCAQLSSASIRRHRGVGLGLTVVERNVRALGGTLSFRSQPCIGSTFTVRIPL